MYALQLVERVLEAAGGINRLPAAGIHLHYHVVQLFVRNGVPIGRNRDAGAVAAGGGERDHLCHKAAVRTAVIHLAAVAKFAVFHQEGRERFLNYAACRLQRQYLRIRNVILTPRNIIGGH